MKKLKMSIGSHFILGICAWMIVGVIIGAYFGAILFGYEVRPLRVPHVTGTVAILVILLIGVRSTNKVTTALKERWNEN